MAIFIEVGALLAAVFLVYLAYKFLKNPIYVLANSVMGMIVFFLLNALLGLGIPINLVSIGVVAIGGISGVLMVLIIHFIGWGF